MRNTDARYRGATSLTSLFSISIALLIKSASKLSRHETSIFRFLLNSSVIMLERNRDELKNYYVSRTTFKSCLASVDERSGLLASDMRLVILGAITC